MGYPRSDDDLGNMLVIARTQLQAKIAASQPIVRPPVVSIPIAPAPVYVAPVAPKPTLIQQVVAQTIPVAPRPPIALSPLTYDTTQYRAPVVAPKPTLIQQVIAAAAPLKPIMATTMAPRPGMTQVIADMKAKLAAAAAAKAERDAQVARDKAAAALAAGEAAKAQALSVQAAQFAVAAQTQNSQAAAWTAQSTALPSASVVPFNEDDPAVPAAVTAKPNGLMEQLKKNPLLAAGAGLLVLLAVSKSGGSRSWK